MNIRNICTRIFAFLQSPSNDVMMDSNLIKSPRKEGQLLNDLKLKTQTKGVFK